MALIYGINAVAETLKADPRRVERVCVEQGRRNSRIQELVDISRRHHLPLSFEEKSWLDRKADGQRHQGILCFVSEMQAVDPESIIDAAKKPGLLLILDGIEDPHNLGAVIRSAELAGVDGIFLPQRRSSSISSTVVKASAGAATLVKIARVGNIAHLIDTLKKCGFWIAGLDAAAGRPLWEADFNIPTALVLGSEGSGLHKLVREKCDFLVEIPVKGRINSHNLSVAAGIALYEVLRQRARR